MSMGPHDGGRAADRARCLLCLGLSACATPARGLWQELARRGCQGGSPWTGDSSAPCGCHIPPPPPVLCGPQISGCIGRALAADAPGELQSLLLVARRVLCPEDYQALLASAASACRRAAAEAAAPAAAAGAAAASVGCWVKLAAAVRDVTPGAPRAVLQAHLDLLNGLAAEWRVADQEAVRATKADLFPLIKACMQELSAAGGSDRCGPQAGR
jgi:hypothetical protein